MRRLSLSNPEKVFLILGLLAGAALCVFIPFGAGFDEETHLVRVYDLAGMHFLPNRSANGGTYTAGEFFVLSYQRRLFQTPAQDLLSPETFNRKIDRQNTFLVPTRSIYPPPTLAVQAVLARLIWLKYSVPVIPGTILLRLAGLLIYLAGTWLALRLLPFGKWILAILALAPMALFQAATVNTDVYNNTVSFLFIALVMRASSGEFRPMRWAEAAGLVGLSLLLGLSKPDAIVILPLLLLLIHRRSATKSQVGLLILGALLAVVTALAWNRLSLAGSHFDAGGEQSLSRQAGLILANPLLFLQTFLQGSLLRFGETFQDWVGVYGHWAGQVPPATYFFYPLALLGVLLAEKRQAVLRGWQRWLTLAVFLAAALSTELVFFAINYIPGDPNSLGRQGRYFTPLAPIFFLAVCGLAGWPKVSPRLARGLSLALLTLSLGLYGFGVYASYYTFCTPSIYTGQACKQPVYKNLDISSGAEIRVTPSGPLSQTFTAVCARVTSVEILVQSVPDLAGKLRLSIDTQDGAQLASRDVDFRELRSGQAYRFDFPASSPIAKVGEKYRIRIEQLEPAGQPGPGFAITGSNGFPDGALFVGADERDTDLIFYYSCPTNGLAGSK